MLDVVIGIEVREKKASQQSGRAEKKQSPSVTEGDFPNHKAVLVTRSLKEVPIKTASPFNFHSGAAVHAYHHHCKLDGLWG